MGHFGSPPLHTDDVDRGLVGGQAEVLVQIADAEHLPGMLVERGHDALPAPAWGDSSVRDSSNNPDAAATRNGLNALSVLPEECQQRVRKSPPEIQEAMAQQWQEDFEADAGQDVLNLQALTKSQKMVASQMALRMVDDDDA
ncbi:hypothetical protein ABZ379_29520 [Streptomyces canus]|uniref:hypothetical protein n=1 Tax=Streptomyces canus TaxID=58343 RepID=UPI0033C2FC37